MENEALVSIVQPRINKASSTRDARYGKWAD